MRLLLIYIVLILSTSAFAEDKPDLLEDLKKEIVKQEVEKKANCLPNIKPVPNVSRNQTDENAISFSLARENCLSQGYSVEFCQKLKEENIQIDPYNMANPRLPSPSEAISTSFSNKNPTLIL